MNWDKIREHLLETIGDMLVDAAPTAGDHGEGPINRTQEEFEADLVAEIIAEIRDCAMEDDQ